MLASFTWPLHSINHWMDRPVKALIAQPDLDPKASTATCHRDRQETVTQVPCEQTDTQRNNAPAPTSRFERTSLGCTGIRAQHALEYVFFATLRHVVLPCVLEMFQRDLHGQHLRRMLTLTLIPPTAVSP